MITQATTELILISSHLVMQIWFANQAWQRSSRHSAQFLRASFAMETTSLGLWTWIRMARQAPLSNGLQPKRMAATKARVKRAITTTRMSLCSINTPHTTIIIIVVSRGETVI